MVHHTKNRDFPQPELSLAEAAAVLAAGQVPSARPGTPAWCAAAASLLEATARKPGNVHPEASFPDLTHAELCAAAGAITPALQQADRQPLGQVIHAAVVAARAVSRSNANLGIVLAVAPLVAASHQTDTPLQPATVRSVLASCTSTDAAAIYAAIQSAGAGGLGTRSEHDLATAPPPCIITAMRHAASTPPADSIAALWGIGYESLWAGPVADLAVLDAAGCGWEQTIIQAALAQLARTPDSLIARRHGSETAAAVSARAAAVQALPAATQPAGLAAFDRFLRQPRRLNPGTTADLIAAALYIHLWTRAALAKEPPPMPEHYHVTMRKAVHVFSAGHFITLNDTLCEPVHGHNWTVACECEGSPDRHGMVVDFIWLRDTLTTIVDRLDHAMLLPTENPLLQVTEQVVRGQAEVEVRFGTRRWVFPADDCRLLPLANTTAEWLARWIGQELQAACGAAGQPVSGGLRIEVDECLGQAAVWQYLPESITPQS